MMIECTDIKAEPPVSTAKKRRLRRKKLNDARVAIGNQTKSLSKIELQENLEQTVNNKENGLTLNAQVVNEPQKNQLNERFGHKLNMSSKESTESRQEVLAARQAAKLAKQNAKKKNDSPLKSNSEIVGKEKTVAKTAVKATTLGHENSNERIPIAQIKSVKPLKDELQEKSSVIIRSSQLEIGKTNLTIAKDKITTDEVDRAFPSISQTISDETSREHINAERAARKALKQAKKIGIVKEPTIPAPSNITLKDVVETLNDIVNVAKEVQEVTAKVEAIDLEANKPNESSKTKAQLRAERRAKQEAQRAAKQIKSTEQKTTSEPVASAKKEESITKLAIKKAPAEVVKDKSPKPKTLDRGRTKSQIMNRVNWFQHLHTQHDKDTLKKIAVNSNLHPAIVKLGVQLATKVVTGSNARCVALLDALKKMVSDYTLPAKTEYARGLESQLATSLEFLWSMRQPSASQTNAVKYFRHLLTQLPNEIDEFDAKKTLQEEIDKYVKEQIDKAGEAISLFVRKKIADGDRILTYGCSSLIERVLVEAHQAGVRFEAVVCGARALSARPALRRLVVAGLTCHYLDITALAAVMPTVNKVILGASALLVNGSVLGALGTAQVALAARAHNVPVLVACETHKVSERVLTDAFVYNEIGDPDDLIDKSDPNSPLKDWRSNPNLTLLNLTYDVTPASLVTAVVTDLAILPCTSAPVVLRFKLSEYGISDNLR